MNQTRCSYVNGYHCEYYNRGACEYIAYCTYQVDDDLMEENRRLLERIKELEAEKEKYMIEAAQARASRDLYADIPIMSAEEILNVIRSKE